MDTPKIKAPKWRGYPVYKKIKSDFWIAFVWYIIFIIIWLIITQGLFALSLLLFAPVCAIIATMVTNHVVGGK